MAKGLNRAIKETAEEDFLKEKTSADRTTKLSFDIVLHVLNTKKKEADDAQKAKTRAVERTKLVEILAKKREAGMEQMSEEEILKRISELE